MILTKETHNISILTQKLKNKYSSKSRRMDPSHKKYGQLNEKNSRNIHTNVYKITSITTHGKNKTIRRILTLPTTKTMEKTIKKTSRNKKNHLSHST
jgi:hypothetical protein